MLGSPELLLCVTQPHVLLVKLPFQTFRGQPLALGTELMLSSLLGSGLAPYLVLHRGIISVLTGQYSCKLTLFLRFTMPRRPLLGLQCPLNEIVIQGAPTMLPR